LAVSETEDLLAPSLAPAQAASAPAHWRICGFVLLLVVIAGVLGALRKDVTQGFDELAHASYVASLQQSGQMWPALDTMRMLDPADFRFTGQANYINHPPPYYWLFAYLGPGLEGQPGAIVIDRLMNVAIVALGLAALMAIALVARLSRPALYAYLIPLACVPVLAPLAGSINNDNTAFAGGALATLAAWQLIATGRRGWLLAALAGVVIASRTKLTGMTLGGGML